MVKNSKALADALIKKGYHLVGGGTENHLVLVDMKRSRNGIDGARVERVMELANVAVNKNTVPGDVSAMTPGGIRMGAPALTSRGFDEKDFEQVAEFFDRGVVIAEAIRKQTGSKIKDFKAALENGADSFPDLLQLNKEVSEFARTFPTIGF